MCCICTKIFNTKENEITISYCKRIHEIPNIIELYNLHHLIIIHNMNINSIPNLKGLEALRLFKCLNISLIYNIKGLSELRIYENNKLKSIPEIQSLNFLDLKNCKGFYNICTSSKEKIKKFYKINKIKQWYNNFKLLKKITSDKS